MLSFSKKAIAGHILVLAIVAFIMTFFLIFITEGFYGSDHIDCKKVNFELTFVCKEDNMIKMNVDSSSSIKFEIVIDGNRNPTKNNIEINGGKTIIHHTQERIITVIPAIFDNGIFMCTGKTKKINKEVLIKC